MVDVVEVVVVVDGVDVVVVDGVDVVVVDGVEVVVELLDELLDEAVVPPFPVLSNVSSPDVAQLAAPNAKPTSTTPASKSVLVRDLRLVDM